jgi:two-component system, OmpR family, sensor histidine kinase VicK
VRWVDDIRSQPGQLAIAAVVGLLALVVLAGALELALHERVDSVTERALQYDIRLEDQGDDLRLAVFNLDLQHRNLALVGPSRKGVDDFDRAYDDLQVEIGKMDELGIRGTGVPQPDRLREMAKTYYTDFRPAIELYDSEPKQFTQASDKGLVRLDELEQAAHEIDKLGEKRASIALKSVEEVSSIARVLLIVLVGGLILIGAAFAYAAVRMVRQIREAREALARALQAKMDFLADASHELRTPLTVVHTNAEVGAQLEEEPAQREIFEDIVNESSQMSRMVENLLFLARSDSESPPLEMEIIAVPTFLAALKGRAEALARGRGASLEANLSGEGDLRADPARIAQAVLILVDNAAKYSPAGERVTLTAKTEAGELLIRVEDRGPGIPEEHLPHIFERFFRDDKARGRKQGGAGLGLSIARTIAQAHGGRIEVESHVGEGTKMSLHLPLDAEPKQSVRTANRDAHDGRTQERDRA